MENPRATKLLHLVPQTLGDASTIKGQLQASFDSLTGCWRVEWLNPSGRAVQAECAVDGGAWSPPRPAAAAAPGKSDSAPAANGVPPGLLASLPHGPGRAGLRSGKRVVGTTPSFPGASLVLCREEAGAWRDVAFADETPEQEIGSVALAVAPGAWLAAYFVAGAAGHTVCRAVQFSLPVTAPAADSWRKLPPYPQAPGMAGMMVGLHHGVLIAAGGANFPDLPPWEGGKKKIYDEIYVLLPGQKAWTAAGRLPGARGYGATVSVPDGVLIAGGEDGEQVFQDTLLLRWTGEKVEIRTGPRLPEPATCAVASVLGSSVYLSGGYGAGAPRVSRNFFWQLDQASAAPQWQVLPSWPGPTRALAVTAALGGAVYLISGIEIGAVDGKETPGVYLKDAYRFRPGGAWEKLPDLPWSGLAAPSPAPVTEHPPRVFVLGGVDGRQVGKLPRTSGLPDDIIYLDVERNTWRHWHERWPTAVVCVPGIQMGDEWIIPSGEIRAGFRTTEVWAWKIAD